MAETGSDSLRIGRAARECMPRNRRSSALAGETSSTAFPTGSEAAIRALNQPASKPDAPSPEKAIRMDRAAAICYK